MNHSSKKLFHNFKNMNPVLPAQTGLSKRKLASKEKCQLQVYGIHSYLEIYRTCLYLEIKKEYIPKVLNSRCTLESPGDFFHKH